MKVAFIGMGTMGAGMAIMYGFYFDEVPRVFATFVSTGAPVLAIIPVVMTMVPSLVLQHRLDDALVVSLARNLGEINRSRLHNYGQHGWPWSRCPCAAACTALPASSSLQPQLARASAGILLVSGGEMPEASARALIGGSCRRDRGWGHL